MMPRWLWPFLASVCLVMVTAIWPMTDTSSLAPGVTAFENGAYDEALSLWETDQPSPAVLGNRAIVHLDSRVAADPHAFSRSVEALGRATDEVHHDFSRPVIINDLKLSDIFCSRDTTKNNALHKKYMR